MPATPKIIQFDEIRVGDTIRVVDVTDVEVTEIHEQRFAGRGGAFYQGPQRSTTERKFQLIAREYPQLPTKPGSMVRVRSTGYVYVLIRSYSRREWTNIETGYARSLESLQESADREGFEVIV